MKGHKLIFTALLALAAGIALIVTHRTVSSGGVVIAGGVMFVLAGFINVIAFLSSRDENGKSHLGSFGLAFGWLTSGAAVVLGLSMLIFQSTFVGLVPFIFGVLVVFGALFQFFVLSVGIRPVTLPAWLYVFPLVLVGLSVYVFMQQSQTDDRMIMLATGIAFTVFGIAMFIEGAMVGAANRRQRREAVAAEASVPADAKAVTDAAAVRSGTDDSVADDTTDTVAK